MDRALSAEPVGVVGAIVAWNVRCFWPSTKIAPALLASCTIVKQARRRNTADRKRFGGSVRRGGPARGVVSREDWGRSGADDLPDIDMFTFTGSSAVSRGRQACAEMLSRAP